MSSLKDRAEKTGYDIPFFHAAAIKIVEEYAGSDNANPKVIPELYKEVMRALIEVHEGTAEQNPHS